MAGHEGLNPDDQCLEELLSFFGVSPMPKTRQLRMQTMVLHVLRMNIVQFDKNGAAMIKHCLFSE